MTDTVAVSVIIIIYLCIHENWFPWDSVTQLRDNTIFSALLRFEKLHKPIDFDLVKRVLVSNVNYCLNLFEKCQISKSN